MTTCGTGGWTGPLPGDPDNNVLLSATPEFGGVRISWTYPTTNPHAVAHVILYRGINSNFANALERAIVQGNDYFDSLVGELTYTYYYWIKLVSVNGTYGEVIGPASASYIPIVDELVDMLTAQLDESALTQSLRSRIEQIDLNALAITTETANRLADSAALAVATSGIQGELAGLIDILGAETAARLFGDAAITGAINDAASAAINESRQRVIDVSDANRSRIAGVEANAEALLTSILANDKNSVLTNAQATLANRQLQESFIEGISVEAAERLLLAAKFTGDINSTLAVISAESFARADAISAEASERTLLATRVLGPDGTALTSGLLYEEKNNRTTEYAALVNQITLLSAGAGEQFDWSSIWYFDSSIEDWSSNSLPTISNGWLRPSNVSSASFIQSPEDLDVEATKYPQVRLRIRKTGLPVFTGFLWWKEVENTTWETSRRVAIEEPTYDSNGIGLITVNLAWSNIIDTIKIELSDAQSDTDFYEVDWISIGRPSPGASSAQLLQESVTRAEEVLAIAETLTVLNSSVNLENGSVLQSLISNAYRTRTDTDSTLAEAQEILRAEYSSKNRIIRSTNAPIQAITSIVLADGTTSNTPWLHDGDVWIDLDDGNKTYVWETDAWVESVDTSLLDTDAFLESLDTAFATSTEATTSSWRAAVSQVIDPVTGLIKTRAAITTEADTRATETSALATENRTLRAASLSLDENALRLILNGEAAKLDAKVTLAQVRQELSSDIEEGLSAEASARETLVAVVDDNLAYLNQNFYANTTIDGAFTTLETELTAAYKDEIEAFAYSKEVTYTKANVDGAIAASETTLKANYEGYVNNYALAKEITYTQSDVNGAIALQATQLRAYSDTSSKIFRQATAPTKRGVDAQTTLDIPLRSGDLWVDTTVGNNNKTYQWNNTAWVDASDTAEFNDWIISTYTGDIAGLSDNKIESWFQTADPSTTWTGTATSHTGDIWYSSVTKLLKLWTGTAWQLIEDKAAIDAAAAADAAQSTADGKITTFTKAGKPTPNTEYPLATASPVAEGTGDLCIDISLAGKNEAYRWSGTLWESVRDLTIADADARITTVELAGIGYCTNTDNTALTLHVSKSTCEADGNVWHGGLPLATAVKQVSVTSPVTGNQVTVESAFTAQQTLNGTLKGQYTVKVDNHNHVIGFGLASEEVDGAIVGEFSVIADKFSITSPDGVENTEPFTYFPAARNMPDGTVLPAGMYINNGYIGQLTANQINSNGLTIRDTGGNLILGAGQGLGSQYYAGGVGSNLVVNGDYVDGLNGVYLGWHSAGNQHILARNLGNLANYMISGIGVAYIHQPGSNGISMFQAALYNGIDGTNFPVVAGTRYEASVLLNPHRCNGSIFIGFVDAANSVLAYYESNIVSAMGSNPSSLAALTRAGLFITAPTNAVKAHILIRATGINSNDPYLFFTHSYFGVAGAAQTEYTPWNPGQRPSLSQGTVVNEGGITLSNGGNIKGGQTAYNNGTGFFLGYESGEYKFSIGNTTTNYMRWTGSALQVRGDVEASSLKANTLMVNTIHIGLNQVTIPVSAYTAASLALPATTWTNVQSVAITSTGAPCFISFSVAFLNAVAQNREVFVRILRDTTEIFTSSDFCLASQRILISGNFTDTGQTAAAHTYYLQLKPNVVSGSAENRSLAALETKR